MTPNEIAMRFRDKLHGYRIIDFARVSLPVYIVRLEVLAINEKPIQIFDEFILRAIDAGIQSQTAISSFLGLDEKFTTKKLADLLRTENISHEVSVYGIPDKEISLTAKGRKALEAAKLVQAKRETIEVLIDGITRQPISDDSIKLIKPVDARSYGLIEIPAIPNNAPDITELANLNLNKTEIRRNRGKSTVQKVLSIIAVSSRIRMMRESVMLVFRSDNAEEYQIWFTIDGRKAASIDESFARGDGVRILRIAEQVRGSGVELGSKPYSSMLNELISECNEYRDDVERTVIPAIVKLQKLEADAISRNQEKALGEDDLIKIESQRAELKQLISKYKVRHLEVHELRNLLDDALNTASQQLYICSEWINDAVLTPTRLAKLDSLLKAGVRINIGYGFGQENTARAILDSEKAIGKLAILSKLYPNLTVRHLNNEHPRVLIKDNDFAVFGIFNWLSFEGDIKRKIRDNSSYLVCDIHRVKQITDLIKASFF